AGFAAKKECFERYRAAKAKATMPRHAASTACHIGRCFRGPCGTGAAGCGNAGRMPGGGNGGGPSAVDEPGIGVGDAHEGGSGDPTPIAPAVSAKRTRDKSPASGFSGGMA